ncbi:hypothetical protein [Corynebacterium freiburgense]|uniref:hypothetical protein n=1 Tax=Corynebacterium freiburgense TaxID=556548 RepID=UPI00040DA7DD|nr:hypothetical protein [Corynebacterium freiburgense]WJZ02187.1 hypothetical protein CFREI_04455 [Corynebacterium freiburgense]
MVEFILAQAERGGPLGPEFGKASPVGLLIIVLLLAAVLFIGWALTRRIKRMARRREFAEAHGIDVFDQEAIDNAMKAEGMVVDNRKQWF